MPYKTFQKSILKQKGIPILIGEHKTILGQIKARNRAIKDALRELETEPSEVRVTSQLVNHILMLSKLYKLKKELL